MFTVAQGDDKTCAPVGNLSGFSHSANDDTGGIAQDPPEDWASLCLKQSGCVAVELNESQPRCPLASIFVSQGSLILSGGIWLVCHVVILILRLHPQRRHRVSSLGSEDATRNGPRPSTTTEPEPRGTRLDQHSRNVHLDLRQLRRPIRPCAQLMDMFSLPAPTPCTLAMCAPFLCCVFKLSTLIVGFP
jgi:hypothetical protein